MAETLLHIISRDEWERARRHGVVAPPSLESQGFVHLSTAHQVHLPANRLYSGRADLLLLHVDPARLGHPVRYEAGVPEDPESVRFPHLYGPLPAEAVVEVTVYEPGADGSFAPCERRGADGVGPQD